MRVSSGNGNEDASVRHIRLAGSSLHPPCSCPDQKPHEWIKDQCVKDDFIIGLYTSPENLSPGIHKHE